MGPDREQENTWFTFYGIFYTLYFTLLTQFVADRDNIKNTSLFLYRYTRERGFLKCNPMHISNPYHTQKRQNISIVHFCNFPGQGMMMIQCLSLILGLEFLLGNNLTIRGKENTSSKYGFYMNKLKSFKFCILIFQLPVWQNFLELRHTFLNIFFSVPLAGDWRDHNSVLFFVFA